MRKLIPFLVAALFGLLAACDEGDPVIVQDEQPFDSIRTDCVPGETVINGQVQFICPDSTG